MSNLASKKLVGMTYANNAVYVNSPCIFDCNINQSYVPPTGSVATIHNVTHQFSYDDSLVINEMYLDFKITTSDTTNYPINKNPFLMLNEIKYLINNQEVTHHKNTESIFSSLSHQLNKLTEDELWATLQKIRTEAAKTTSGDSDLSGGTVYYSLPLSWIFPELKNITTVDGVQRLSFNFRFNPDYATAAGNGRFICNATTTNGWASSKITVSDIVSRLHSVRYSNVKEVPRVPKSFMILNKFEVKQYSISWNTATTDTQRVQLNSDFSFHKKIMGVYLYVYPNGLVTTTSDADCMKTYSNSTYISYVVKYKSRVLIDMAGPTNGDLIKRKNYQHDVHLKRYGIPPIASKESLADDLPKLFLINTYIDLSCIEQADADTENIGGISNATNDLELIAYCASGLSTTCTLNAVVHYIETAEINPSNGLVTLSA